MLLSYLHQLVLLLSYSTVLRALDIVPVHQINPSQERPSMLFQHSFLPSKRLHLVVQFLHFRLLLESLLEVLQSLKFHHRLLIGISSNGGISHVR